MSETRADTDGGCPRIEEAISAGLDGEDPGAAASAVDAHLAGCAACRAFRDSAVALDRRVADTAWRQAPDLSGRILAALPDGPAPAERRGRTVTLPQTGIAAALLLVVVVAGYLIGTHVGGHPATSATATVQQVQGSTQTSPLYPGATVLPASASQPKPSVVLTDTSGRAYDLARATAGRVTLLYFGYTHCPDVCPLAMGLTADAVSGLPAPERKDVSVVFVTTDPTRDTPTVMRRWLAAFSGPAGDPAFVGLTGPLATIHRAEHQVGMPLSQIKGTQVVHAGYILAYGPDGMAHLSIDETETPAQYTTTIRNLITRGFTAA